MVLFTYELIAGGFRIYRDGLLYIDQYFDPDGAGYPPLSPDEAVAMAQGWVSRLSVQQNADTPVGGA
jgi:hypothetical protein